MKGVFSGIILSIALIVFLEIFRLIRMIANSSREINKLKRKVNNIEKFLKNQDK